jgi:hypothetical protein
MNLMKNMPQWNNGRRARRHMDRICSAFFQSSSQIVGIIVADVKKQVKHPAPKYHQGILHRSNLSRPPTDVDRLKEKLLLENSRSNDSNVPSFGHT